MSESREPNQPRASKRAPSATKGSRTPARGPSPPPAPRQRNARGEGHRLRKDILAAAESLLERSGSEEAVTLRAVAREVGIATTSVYGHFPDRDAIVRAVIDGAFAELGQTISAAITQADGAMDSLLGGCRTYVEYGLHHPARYRVLFNRRSPGRPGAKNSNIRLRSSGPPGEAVFRMLVEGIRKACPGSEPVRDATLLWLVLHGLVTLHASTPWFEWPAISELISDAVTRLCPDLVPGPSLGPQST